MKKLKLVIVIVSLALTALLVFGVVRLVIRLAFSGGGSFGRSAGVKTEEPVWVSPTMSTTDTWADPVY